MDVSLSRKWSVEASKYLVGGVNSPVRSFKSVGGKPLVMSSGKGAKLKDVDGNTYTDYCLSWGALILGHARQEVMKAVHRALTSGTSFGTTTKPEVELARMITKEIESIDKVRFVNSGTEATMSAIRLARGFTGRNMIVKFDGCYHGHFDDLLIQAGSGVANLKKSSSRGITPQHIYNTISLPFNDTDALRDALYRNKKNIACVILEPVAGNMGVVKPTREFLSTLRDLTRKLRIVLIFDEVMTGFRVARGGAQSLLGVIPDMTCLGKIIGGGLPVGAYGGRKDIMDCLSPIGGVYQAGTFSGTPVVMQAGIATLKLLDRTFYKRLNSLCGGFAQKMNSYFQDRNLPVYLEQFNSMMSLRFGKGAAQDYAQALRASSRDKYSGLFHKLLKSGIYWPPAELETFFVSGAHNEKDLALLFKTVANHLGDRPS